MKKLLPVFSATCLLLCGVAYADASLSSSTTDASYAMGYRAGQSLKSQSIAVDSKSFNSGFQAGYSGQKSIMSDAAMQTALTNMQKEVMGKMQQQYSKDADGNTKTGEAFLAENGKKPGVVTTASGLQYEIIDKGDGSHPTASDTVTVNYEGKLIDGTVFDSSYKRGQPATFQVGGVIQGWQEALKLMQPGATWMLYIPSKLAYGSRGAGGAIGPNETLIFKVNLISVTK